MERMDLAASIRKIERKQMKSFKDFSEDVTEDVNDGYHKLYNDNKKKLQSLHKKAKRTGGQVHVDFEDHKGRKQSGFYNGMMRMGAHTYAKIEPHKQPGPMTALPIHQATNIRHVTK